MYKVEQEIFAENTMRCTIYVDDDQRNPRTEWDNCTHFILTEGFGDSKDVQGELERLCEKYNIEDYEERGMLQLIDALNEFIVIKPVCMYQHSGATIYFGSPIDRWDSGYIGFAYMTLDDVNGDMCGRNSKDYPNWRDQAEACLKGEMYDLDHYVRGDIYGYVIEKLINPTWQDKLSEDYDEDDWLADDEHWEEYDSCWGFYQDYDELLKEQVEAYTPDHIVKPFPSEQLKFDF
jgi:hypothetical protein